MKYYKLTGRDMRTMSNTLWGENITHKAMGCGTTLCSSDVIHVYDHPLKAVIFNPIHADFNKPILWCCKVKKVVSNDGLKVGVKECTTVKIIPLPKITTNQRIRFAILCALEVYKEKGFVNWAENWLNGNDRTQKKAGWAARAAKAAWAVEAAWAAARAAETAQAAARAAETARAASRAAEAAERAARAAARAAEAAWAVARATKFTKINFVLLLKKAIKDEEKFEASR